jgi:hypothetical protein
MSFAVVKNLGKKQVLSPEAWFRFHFFRDFVGR